MTINQKEEAMGYQRISVRQILLLTGLGVLLWSLAGAIGCGSNETPSSSRQDEKPAASAKPLVEEILPEPRPGATVPLQLSLGLADANVMEVIPPDRPGIRGVTAAEVEAARAKPIDLELVEVIPPANPGGRGVTAAEVAEVMERTAAASPPEDNLVIPSPLPPNGARSVTGSK